MSTAAAPTPSPAPALSARARQVELILERVRTLPTLSPVAARLLAIGTIDEVLIQDVVKIIETDPALSARILGLCRKADRGLGDRITTVKRAVLMLGIEAVRSAALSVSVYDLMTREDESARAALDATVATAEGAEEASKPLFDRHGFWKHSIAVACAAEITAQLNPKLKVLPEEAFLAGLLHDVGKLVLDLVLPRSYQRVLEVAQRRACDSAGVERTVLGLDHHSAGRRVAEHWGLPDAIQSVIWMHGQPFAVLPDSPDRNLIGVVTLAKAVARRVHLGWSGDFGAVADAEAMCHAMGLKSGGTALIAAPLHGAVADRLKVLGLDDTTPPGLLLESLANANRQLSDLNAALQERAGHSQSQSRVLDAVEQFHALNPMRRTITETMGVVCQSAAASFGEGFYAVLVQTAPEDPWRMVQLGFDGCLREEQLMEAPPARVGGATLASLSSPTQLNVSVLGLLPWLSDHLVDGPDLRKLRLLPLAIPEAPGPRATALAGVVITDRDMGDGLTPKALRAVTATWACALAAAAEREDARRLHDQLLESNRAVADMQARLAEQESMARLGETTAGAAHEMNNPLTVIAGHGQLLLSRLENDRDRAAAGAIANAAKDLSNLISSLHLLSEMPRIEVRRVRVEGVIEQAITAARARTGADCVVSVSCTIAEADLDADAVTAALAELIANALEAGGAAAVRIAARADGARVSIEVEDAGPGLSDRARVHAFDPFFSERGAGRGKGLGLTRARRLARAHNGDVRLEPLTPGVRAVIEVAP